MLVKKAPITTGPAFKLNCDPEVFKEESDSPYRKLVRKTWCKNNERECIKISSAGPTSVCI